MDAFWFWFWRGVGQAVGGLAVAAVLLLAVGAAYLAVRALRGRVQFRGFWSRVWER